MSRFQTMWSYIRVHFFLPGCCISWAIRCTKIFGGEFKGKIFYSHLKFKFRDSYLTKWPIRNKMAVQYFLLLIEFLEVCCNSLLLLSEPWRFFFLSNRTIFSVPSKALTASKFRERRYRCHVPQFVPLNSSVTLRSGPCKMSDSTYDSSYSSVRNYSISTHKFWFFCGLSYTAPLLVEK
jgi:hypothetical protein